MSLAIDHVVFCVADLEAASSDLRSADGLESLEGGRHTGHGTANAIVPLGETYLELVTVIDRAEAESSRFGMWVLSHAGSRLIPHAVCLRTDDIDAVASRLGLVPTAMSRERPDGAVLRWRIAGLDRALSENLPFYVRWDIDPADHPGRSSLPQANSGLVTEVSLTGDPRILAEWVGEARYVYFEEGEPGIEWAAVRAGSQTQLDSVSIDSIIFEI